MVAPITSKPIEKWTLKGPPTSAGFAPNVYTYEKRRYKQARPYNLPMPYFHRRQTASYQSTDPNDYTSANLNAYNLGWGDQAAQIKAYERCREGVITGANLAVNIGERKQALGMMSNRLMQAAYIARALRRGSIRDALDVAGPQAAERYRQLSAANKARLKSKEFSNRWLEFHFGWEPLVKDIWSTVNLLDSPFPYKPFRGHGTARYAWSGVTSRVDTTLHYHLETSGKSVKFTRCYGGFMMVTNPNLFMANQLGLINPAVVAWELVPYSFVVDWFTGIGDYLRSFTDWVGVRIENPFSFTAAEGTQSFSYVGIDRKINGVTGALEITHERVFSWTKTDFQFQRGTSTPTMPRPKFTLPQRLSPTRGLTAASLLLKELKLR